MVHDEMIELGETLKKRRKELNISLKEVENATSIRMGYLEAIEEGEMNRLISPVYAQGFIRQYAGFLGLDTENIIRQFPKLFSPPAAQEFAYGIGTLEMRGNPGSTVKWLPNAIWIGVFIALIGVAWFLAKFLEVM